MYLEINQSPKSWKRANVIKDKQFSLVIANRYGSPHTELKSTGPFMVKWNRQKWFQVQIGGKRAGFNSKFLNRRIGIGTVGSELCFFYYYYFYITVKISPVQWFEIRTGDS